MVEVLCRSLDPYVLLREGLKKNSNSIVQISKNFLSNRGGLVIRKFKEIVMAIYIHSTYLDSKIVKIHPLLPELLMDNLWDELNFKD